MQYYLHDTNSFDDEKVSELFIEYGYEGLGLFYTVLEKLAKQEQPIKTVVLKKQLRVGKKLEKVWTFMEHLDIISSRNGETFNDNLLKKAQNYQIKKEKTRMRVAKWRDNQKDIKTVTPNVPVSNPLKEKKRKENKIKENKTIAKSVLLSQIKISEVPQKEVIYFQYAKAYWLLFKNYRESIPMSIKSLKTAKYVAWVSPIRLLLTTDEHKEEDLKKVAEFLKKGKNDFWMKTISSTYGLRKNFVQLIMKSNENKNFKNETGVSEHYIQSLLDGEDSEEIIEDI